jgi:O-antigen biosynthesis protein
MYGEDIDLSYRLQVGSWKNYYFAGTTIIHFKGESTKKGTLNYVRMFYKAMEVFVQKHYTTVTAFFFKFFITIGIWLRAGISAIAGFVRRIGLPIFDAINILVSFVAAKLTWNAIVKPETIYDQGLLSFALPAFTGIFIVAAYYAGLYDKSQKRGRVIHSTLISTTALLVIYSLLPEHYRFSRGILLLGSLFAFVLLSLNRALLRKWKFIEAEEEEKLGTVIAGSEKEYERAITFMQGAEKEQRVLGRIGPDNDDGQHLTTMAHLPHLLRDVPLREIIFCQGTLSFKDIIQYCSILPEGIRMRIISCGAMAIIGSDSSSRSGETLSWDAAYAIGTPSSKRLKRLLDIMVSGIVIIGFPIHLLFVKRPLNMLQNASKVMAGSMTWIGYSSAISHRNGLPTIKKGVLGTNGLPPTADPDTEDGLYMLDQMYAREYSIYRDIYLLIKGYKWISS